MNSYELFIGVRYTRSRQRTRFISVISPISIVGIALGMTLLITVLSVFNGFQREVRTRMLGAVAHVQVQGLGETLPDWKATAQIAAKHREVKATAPYVAAQGLITSGGNVRGAFVRGMSEPRTRWTISVQMRRGEPHAQTANKAYSGAACPGLGVDVGDRGRARAPQGQSTPRADNAVRQFTVVGKLTWPYETITLGSGTSKTRSAVPDRRRRTA